MEYGSFERDASIGWHTALVAALALLGTAVPGLASAFCGFYVSGASEDLYNNATRVAMMRDDQRTVLSMQNNYQGPPENFAMVVPVPEVLKKKQVKTIQDSVFDRLDELTAPRLVEYWQKDPCERRVVKRMATGGAAAAAPSTDSTEGAEVQDEVTVEAQFDVGEYEIVVLSAKESNALDTWLKQNDYNIPDGAAQYFRPYVQQGSYFFVAKVNVDKVQFRDGQAVLSPLRFHYQSDEFKLPVRLGLINSRGSQDLIAYLLARRQRYRVANYPNVTIPTNLPVDESIKNKFASFYDTLFERVLEDQPKAVVTEYSWTASKCDPCPVPPLEPNHLQTLGADVLIEQQDNDRSKKLFGGGVTPSRADYRGWTVTRLHTRYSRETLGQDLVFEKAPAIRGGRGEPKGKEGEMVDQEPKRANRNNFQARYIVRHFWEGDVDCDDPRWGRWGGRGGTKPAGDLGFQGGSGPVELGDAVQQKSVPQIGRLEASASDGNDTSESTDSPEFSEDGDGASSSSGDDFDSGDTSDEDDSSDDVDLDEAVEQEEIPGVDDEQTNK